MTLPPSKFSEAIKHSAVYGPASVWNNMISIETLYNNCLKNFYFSSLTDYLKQKTPVQNVLHFSSRINIRGNCQLKKKKKKEFWWSSLSPFLSFLQSSQCHCHQSTICPAVWYVIAMITSLSYTRSSLARDHRKPLWRGEKSLRRLALPLYGLWAKPRTRIHRHCNMKI